MKKIILRFNISNRNSFDSFVNIKNGTKSVETRAATKKYRGIKAGDIIIFSCGKEKFSKIVKRVRYFKTIGLMLKEIKLKSIMPGCNSAGELEKSYYSYPNYHEKIKKFGLAAIEFEK